MWVGSCGVIVDKEMCAVHTLRRFIQCDRYLFLLWSGGLELGLFVALERLVPEAG